MTAAHSAQSLQLLALVNLAAMALQLGMGIISQPRLRTLATRDRKSLLRQMRTAEMIRQIRRSEDQRVVRDKQHENKVGTRPPDLTAMP